MFSKKTRVVFALVLAFMLLTLGLNTQGTRKTAMAQNYLDVRRIMPVAYDFFNALSRAGNISVQESTKCGRQEYQQWGPGTFARPTKVFARTVGNIVLIQADTDDPPAALNGQRARMIDAPPNMDDSGQPVWDRGYLVEYRKWVPRHCLDLTSMLRNSKYEELWLSLLKRHGGAEKFAAELEALGLDPKTGTRYDTNRDFPNLRDENTIVAELSAELPTDLAFDVAWTQVEYNIIAQEGLVYNEAGDPDMADIYEVQYLLAPEAQKTSFKLSVWASGLGLLAAVFIFMRAYFRIKARRGTSQNTKERV
ncbi:MAG: hypothetical protein ACOZAO_01075 [Patescibacteria group bacterium]